MMMSVCFVSFRGEIESYLVAKVEKVFHRRVGLVKAFCLEVREDDPRQSLQFGHQ
jgi:hypothetical protein